jgi:hypothetical protein
MFRVNYPFKGFFQWCIEKQVILQDFPGVVLKSSIFQKFLADIKSNI